MLVGAAVREEDTGNYTCELRGPRSWDRNRDHGTKVLTPRFWDRDLGTKVLRPRHRFWHESFETKAEILAPRSWVRDLGRSWERDLATKVLRLRPRSWYRVLKRDLGTKILRPRPIFLGAIPRGRHLWVARTSFSSTASCHSLSLRPR